MIWFKDLDVTDVCLVRNAAVWMAKTALGHWPLETVLVYRVARGVVVVSVVLGVILVLLCHVHHILGHRLVGVVGQHSFNNGSPSQDQVSAVKT